MAMFTKLFAIKIVASNFLGLNNKDWIILSFEFSDSSISSNCIGVREKKATSEPEIRAENNNKTSNETISPINVTRSEILKIISRKRIIYRGGSN